MEQCNTKLNSITYYIKHNFINIIYIINIHNININKR